MYFTMYFIMYFLIYFIIYFIIYFTMYFKVLPSIILPGPVAELFLLIIQVFLLYNGNIHLACGRHPEGR